MGPFEHIFFTRPPPTCGVSQIEFYSICPTSFHAQNLNPNKKSKHLCPHKPQTINHGSLGASVPSSSDASHTRQIVVPRAGIEPARLSPISFALAGAPSEQLVALFGAVLHKPKYQKGLNNYPVLVWRLIKTLCGWWVAGDGRRAAGGGRQAVDNSTRACGSVVFTWWRRADDTTRAGRGNVVMQTFL
jgi:hypothetical protein